MTSWINEAVVYHFYTLGFCGAEPNNMPTIETKNRIKKVKEWIPYLKELGVNTILFAPLFESESHGYNTIDFCKVDKRLGTNEDFKEVCDALHEEGFRILLDGVFNHVGRGFFAFQDLQEKRHASQYIDWFVNIRFNGNSPLGDSFYYEGWEGHYELVKLNLNNGAVRNYLFDVIKEWIHEYQIDGLRLDVAYSLDKNFLRGLRQFVDSQKEDFWLMGEIIHGNYKTLIQSDMLDSTTNYECYKGIYSSHNDKNYFEINHSLNRLFSHGGIYEGEMLYNFVDNHDVVRIATILRDERHLKNVFTLLFTMPGIPSIYYGSEWAIEGDKRFGDIGLRPCIELCDMLQRNQDLKTYIQKLIRIRKVYEPLKQGIYEQVIVRNEQLIFARNFENDKIYVALNLDSNVCMLDFGVKSGTAWVNLLEESEVYTEHHGRVYLSLAPYESKIFVERTKIKSPAQLKEIPKKDDLKNAKSLPTTTQQEKKVLEILSKETPDITSKETKKPNTSPKEMPETLPEELKTNAEPEINAESEVNVELEVNTKAELDLEATPKNIDDAIVEQLKKPKVVLKEIILGSEESKHTKELKEKNLETKEIKRNEKNLDADSKTKRKTQEVINPEDEMLQKIKQEVKCILNADKVDNKMNEKVKEKIKEVFDVIKEVETEKSFILSPKSSIDIKVTGEEPAIVIEEIESINEVEKDSDKQELRIKVTIQRKPHFKLGIEIEDNPMIAPHITIEEKNGK